MDALAWFDLAIVAVVLASSLLGAWRGMAGEILALAAWLAAFFAARAWGSLAGHWLAMLLPALGDPLTRQVAGLAAVFVATLMLFAMTRLLLTNLLRAIGLGMVDRLLGALFGIARGLLIAWLAVLLAGLTRLPQQPWWRASVLAPPLETAVVAGKPWLPPALAQRIHYRTGHGTGS